jgi:Ala-tRNA(Pro) deacylase
MSAEIDPESLQGAAWVHQRLTEAGVAHEMLEHPPTYRARDEAEAVGEAPGAVAKTVVALDHDSWWLVVVPSARSVDLHRLREHTGGSRHQRLATEEEIAARFPQFEVGAIPPLGALLGLPQVVAPHLMAHDRIICPGGDHRHAFRLAPGALVDLARAGVADVCSHPDEGRRTRFTEVSIG